MLYYKRKAFTMIELIFVIVIIGILAAVAIPKLATNKDDAQATICASEFGNIVTEISSNYVTLGYTDFQTLKIGSMSNVKSDVSSPNTGIVEGAEDNVINSISYICEGDTVGVLSFESVSAIGDYNLTITPSAGATMPSAITTVALIKKNYKMEIADLSADITLSY